MDETLPKTFGSQEQYIERYLSIQNNNKETYTFSSVGSLLRRTPRNAIMNESTMQTITYASTASTHVYDCLLPLEHIVPMMFINILSVVVGSIGNVLVVATVYTTLNLHSISNYFLASMAVADLLVTAFAQPFFVGFLGAQITPLCSSTVELLFRLLANMSSSASVLHLCLVSIDRCLIVIKPHSFNQILSKSRFHFLLVLSWLLPVIYGILRLTVNKSATSYFTVITVAVCYVVIIVCYALIVSEVHKQRRSTRASLRGHAKQSALRDKVERRVTVTIAIVIVAFTVCWFPILYLRSVNAEKNSGRAYNWARTLALCNSAMNPLIYCYRIQEFRAAYKRLFCKCRWGIHKTAGVADATTHTSESGIGSQNMI